MPFVPRLVHLSGLYPSHFWTIGEASKSWERVERKPKTLQPLMHALVDDLLHWEDGGWVVDHSADDDDPDRLFFLRCILLYWCGDYPGQGEASGFSHAASSSKACHWCEEAGVYSNGLHRMVFGGYERYLVRVACDCTCPVPATESIFTQVASPRSCSQGHNEGSPCTEDPRRLMPARP